MLTGFRKTLLPVGKRGSVIWIASFQSFSKSCADKMLTCAGSNIPHFLIGYNIM